VKIDDGQELYEFIYQHWTSDGDMLFTGKIFVISCDLRKAIKIFYKLVPEEEYNPPIWNEVVSIKKLSIGDWVGVCMEKP
jgi:hypothetical protein